MELSGLGDDFPTGVSHLTILTVNDANADSKTETLGKLTTPDGKTTSISLTFQKEEPKDEASKDDASTQDDTNKDADIEVEDSTKLTDVVSEPVEMVFPLGAYGFNEKPEQPAAVLFRGLDEAAHNRKSRSADRAL